MTDDLRRHWSGVAETYRRTFRTLCLGTVPELLRATAGTTLLDVGCGTGDLALAAAARGLRVTAVDPDPDMVEVTRGVVHGTDVSVHRAGLPHLGLAPVHDTVVANFVVNHVPDPWAAVRGLAAAARPGGRVLVSVWSGGHSVRAQLLTDALAAADAVPVPGVRLAPHLDFERSPAGLAALLSDGGLTAATAHESTFTWRVSWPDLWAGIAGGIGGGGTVVRAQTPAVQARIERELRLRAEALTVDGLVELPTVAVIGAAEVPPGPSGHRPPDRIVR